MERARNIICGILVLLLLTAAFARGEEPPRQGEFEKALSEGIGLMHEKKWNESIRLFEELTRRAPGRWEGHLYLGVSYLELGRHSEAEKELNEAIRIDPRQPESHAQMGRLFEETQRLQEALDSYERVLQLNPIGELASLSLLKTKLIGGILLARSGNMETALRLFKEAAALAPDNPDPYYNIGLVYLRRNQEALAEEAFLKVVSLNPGHLNAHLNLGKLYERLGEAEKAEKTFFILGSLYERSGRLQEAEAAFLKVIAFNPENQEAYLDLGNLYERNNRIENALSAFGKGFELNPETPGGRRARIKLFLLQGILLARTGNFDSALRMFEEGIEVAPDDPELHYHVGLVHLRRNEDALAETAFLKVVSLDPQYQDAYLSLGDLYERHGQIDEALTAFAKGFEVNPTSPGGGNARIKLFLLEGNVLARRGAFDDALKLLEQALRFSPDPAPIYFNIAQIYLSRGDLVKGEEALNSTLQIDPKHQAAILRLGILYEQQGKLDEALAAYERARDINPKSPDGVGAAVSVHSVKGNLATRAGRLDEAITEFQEATEIQPKNSANFYNLGLVYLKKNDLSSAEKVFEKVIALDPSEGEAYLSVGDIQQATNREAEALQTYETLIAKGSGPAVTLGQVRLHLLKGAIFGREGNYNQARAEFEEVIRINPKEPRGYLNLGLTHLKRKKPDAAVEAFKKLVELDPTNRSHRVSLANLYQELGRPKEALDLYQGLLEEEGTGAAFQDEIREKIAVLFSTLSVGYQVSYDSNINLSKEGIGDFKSELFAQYQRLFDFGKGWRGGLRVSPDFYSFHSAQVSVLNTQAGIFGEKRGYQRGLTLGYNFQVGMFEGSLSNRSHELAVDGFAPATRGTLFGSVHARYTKSFVNPAFNGVQPSLSTGLLVDQLWGGRWIFGTGFYGNFNTLVEGNDYAYLGFSPSLSYDVLLIQGITLNLNYNYTFSRYLHPDSAFDQIRLNQAHSFGGGITIGLEKGLELSFKGSWLTNRSNLAGATPSVAGAQTAEKLSSLGDYDRWLTTIGLRLSF